MAGKKMGYQGLLYYGVAGSTATTLVKTRVDATVERSLERGSTTQAGDGTKVPITTSHVTGVTEKVTFNVLNDESDPVTAFLQNNIYAAFKFISCDGGWTFDRDCSFSLKVGAPLKGEQTTDIDTEVTDKFREVTSTYE